MSDSPSSDHLAAQIVVAQQAASRIESALTLIDPQEIKATTPAASKVIKAITDAYGRASITLAMRRYLQARREARITGALPRLPIITMPAMDKIAPQVEWAVSGLYGPINDEPITIGPNFYLPYEVRREAAATKLAGVTDRLVADAGRDQLLANVENDQVAIGWARVPEPDCCAFCALLATRGGVYKDDSFAEANKRFAGHTDMPSDVKTHDHCRCHVEPVFYVYEPSAQIREWTALYENQPDDFPNYVRGAKTRGDDAGKARNASEARILGFRRAYEAKYPRAAA